MSNSGIIRELVCELSCDKCDNFIEIDKCPFYPDYDYVFELDKKLIQKAMDEGWLLKMDHTLCPKCQK